MAYRRRKPYAKKRRPIRRRRAPRKMTIFRGPVAKTLMVRMKYCQFNQLDPTIGGVHAKHYFRWNSIFDPDQTGTGHQPLGHDQYSQLYNHYTVVGAKATCIFSSTSAVGTDACIVGLRTDEDTATAPLGLYELCEQQGSTWTTLGNRNNKSVVKLTKTFSLKKHFGSTDKWNRAGLGAEFGANPTTVAYLEAFAAPIDASQDAAVINTWIYISYTVLLTDPKELGSS